MSGFVAVGTIALAVVTYLSNKELRKGRSEDIERVNAEKKYRFVNERISNYYTPLLNKYFTLLNSNRFINDLLEVMGKNMHLASNELRYLIIEYYNKVFTNCKPSEQMELVIRIYKQAWKEYETLADQIYQYSGERFMKVENANVAITNLEKALEIMKKQGN